ncbi:MAG: hypothetical protein ACI9R8_001916 [Candidatus Paceibacteria bacterium]|jgi:hypothetical protein
MKDDRFFVGYLPFPHGLRRFYLVLIPLLLVIGVGTSLLLASNQETVGGGTWQVSNMTSVTGRLIMEPYPVLHTEAGESVLMVVQGKQDASSATMPFSGEMVTATGFDVRRGGWHMLEIPQTGAIVAAPEAIPVTVPVSESLGTDTLVGEVVDSKCFLGVMKPGSGKVHRACASLCLLGGMPPMLVVKTESDRYGYVLVNADGSSASRQLAGQVAMPIRITGEFEKRGDLTYLRMPRDQRSTELLTGAALNLYGETLAVDAMHPQFCGVLPTNSLES